MKQSHATLAKAIICITVLLSACGGSLSEEQRKKMKEGMEQQKIVKLSDSEIMNVAMEQGRAVYSALESVQFNPAKADSIAKQHHATLSWVKPGASNAREIEQQLIDAYITGIATGSLQENIQKIRIGHGENYDSLVYSKPVVKPMPDGVENLEGVWNIYLSRKHIILSSH